MARRSFFDDRRGQMMLFAAIVLIMAFVAMNGALSRINQLASETVQDQGDPFFLEVEAVANGIDAVIEEWNGASQPADYAAELELVLGHFAVHEQGRGFIFDWEPPVCDPTDGYVEWTLQEGNIRVTLRSGVSPDC